MSVPVEIANLPRTVTAEPGQTVLAAAVDAGIPYPHGCRFGNCGACKSRLVAGVVDMLPHSSFALTPEERDDGLILACRAVPKGPATVAWLDADDLADHPRRTLDCEVRSIDDVTHDIRRIRLRIRSGGPFAFSAGQFASVTFEGVAPRDYSMANRPVDPNLEFHIRTVAGGAASAYVRDRLAVGAMVRVEGPSGASHLREGHKGPILAVAGGSGLAPIKSIVETALAKRMAQPISLYFGVREERDLYLEPLFRALERKYENFSFIPVLSSPDGTTERRTGFVHEAVTADTADFDGVKIYTAGPPVMVEALTAAAVARGLRREDLHADPFYTAAEAAALAGPAD